MSTPILLLDATWRIDRVIGAERACELLVTDRAIQASEDIAAVMRSPSITVEIPSVIATIHTSPRVWRLPQCTPRRVRQRDRHRCQFVIDGAPCERRGDSVDHLLPSSRGGDDTWTNLVAACRRHNGFKADRTLAEMTSRYGWSLGRRPYVPSHDELIATSIRQPPAGWLPYLPAPA